MYCFLEVQEMRFGPKKRQNPVVDQQESRHPELKSEETVIVNGLEKSERQNQEYC